MPSSAGRHAVQRAIHLRGMAASTAIMASHIQMAALALKDETTIEGRKMAGMVRPLIWQKRMSAGS
jgi:hypothetical protein